LDPRQDPWFRRRLARRPLRRSSVLILRDWRNFEFRMIGFSARNCE
jgi:hypothetical protein